MPTDEFVAKPSGMPAGFQKYWLAGKGAAKIRWGTEGDFKRCERALRKYLGGDAAGACNRLHVSATGGAPGKGHAADGLEEFHLTHNQKTHGNRIGNPNNLPSKTGLGKLRGEQNARLGVEPTPRKAAPKKAARPAAKEGNALGQSAADREARGREMLGDKEYERRTQRDQNQGQLNPAGRAAYKRAQAAAARAEREGAQREEVSDGRNVEEATARPTVMERLKAQAARNRAQMEKNSRRDPREVAMEEALRRALGGRRYSTEDLEALTMAELETLVAHGDDLDTDEYNALHGYGDDKKCDPKKEDCDEDDEFAAELDTFEQEEADLVPVVRTWSGLIAPINVPTGDKRRFATGSLSNRDLPLPLLWQQETSEGHKQSVVVGRVTAIDHDGEGGTHASGDFLPFAKFPDAEKAYELLDNEVVGPSVDLDDVTFEYRAADGTAFNEAEFLEAAQRGENPDKPEFVVTKGRISAVTLVAVPAFAEAKLTLGTRADTDGLMAELTAAADCEDCEADEAEVLVASGYVAPPAWAFDDPKLDGPTPPTVDDDGTVYGHLATWGSCHVGFPGACVTPPESKAQYAYFHTGEVTTDDGQRLAVGRLMLGAKHANIALGFKASAQHYDETGRVVALVRVYEDAHGIAFAGVLVQDLDDETRAQFRANPLSGDWRRIGGNLELIGAISVAVPGFPVARVQNERQEALVAAGAWGPEDLVPVVDQDSIRALVREELATQQALAGELAAWTAIMDDECQALVEGLV